MRFGETDLQGVVYYANYLLFAEVGRIAFLRQLGVVYERERVIERPAYPTPVSASNVNVGPTTAVVARNDAVWAVTRIVTLLFTVL